MRLWTAILPLLIASSADASRVCVLVSRGGASAPELRELRSDLESAVQGELIPSKACADAGRNTSEPPENWLKTPTIGHIADAAGVDLIVTASVTDRKVSLLALDAASGDPVGARTVLWAERDRAAGSVERWTTRHEPGPSKKKAPEPTGEWSFGGDDAFASFDDQFDAAATATNDKLLPTGMEIRGALRLENHTPSQRLADRQNGRNSIDARLSLRYQRGDFTLSAGAVARRDAADSDRDRLQAGEIYAEYHKSPVTLRAGRFLAAWGRANLSSPVDILNPMDVRDPLAREKLPTEMLRLEINGRHLGFEATYIPFVQGHLVPFFDGVDGGGQLLHHSRWIDDRLLPMNRRYTLLPELKSQRRFNAQGAARLTLSAGGFDIALGAARLHDRLPTLRVIDDPQAMTTAIGVEYRPVHYGTLEVERAFGKLHVVGEALATLTENFGVDVMDDAIEVPSWQAMVGADYRTEEFADGHYVHLFLEYHFASGIGSPIQRDPLHFARRPFLYQILGRIHYDWGESLDIAINAASSPIRFDTMIAPEIRYTYRDTVTVGLKGVLLRGHTTESFYGAFEHNSRIESTVEARF